MLITVNPLTYLFYKTVVIMLFIFDKVLKIHATHLMEAVKIYVV